MRVFLSVLSCLDCGEVTTFNHQVSYCGLVTRAKSIDEDTVSLDYQTHNSCSAIAIATCTSKPKYPRRFNQFITRALLYTDPALRLLS
ncbi:hypothetical protein IW261DRAFT_458672 [Armillaria novae-zelandiae]|uniref:Uncharacterized protein n=1 Tax=Armillaria novae-zelandiae TaxID=153914 RepID=A0AA39U732_9AGAR|nr:hypothetical protein IW261DRAFT_458672 [Armillaria novae-zelandiae]